MNRQPATLSCFAVFNSTLTSTRHGEQDEDEDADQQAQILFYTSKERAVSKDRMLRQVGLAQALIAFSDRISGPGGDQSRQDVHSLTSRMVMISPEPDYWIFASIDVARTPRPQGADVKGKGKAADSGEPPSMTSFNYSESSLKDTILREHLTRGYEEFKLLHGPFGMILAESGGQAALQRKLENFFALWVWQWDIDASSATFGDHLPQLTQHPHYSQVADRLRVFKENWIHSGATFFVLNSGYILRTPRINASDSPANDDLTSTCPPSLPQYMLRTIVSKRVSKPGKKHMTSMDDRKVATTNDNTVRLPSNTFGGSFRISSTTLNPKNWGLGTYFNPSSWTAGSKIDPPSSDSTPADKEVTNASEGASTKAEDSVDVDESRKPSVPKVNGDPSDAMASSQATITKTPIEDMSPLNDLKSTVEDRNLSQTLPEESQALLAEASSSSLISTSETSSLPNADVKPQNQFQHTKFFLPSRMQGASEVILRRKVWYITTKDSLLALIPPLQDEDTIQSDFQEAARLLLDELEESLRSAEGQVARKSNSTRESLVSDGEVKSLSQSLTLFSSHLFEAGELLRHSEIEEVITRPSSSSRPWTASKRETRPDDETQVLEIHIEVPGANSTLVDVDRELSMEYTTLFSESTRT